jgi:hypothetical protein
VAAARLTLSESALPELSAEVVARQRAEVLLTAECAAQVSAEYRQHPLVSAQEWLAVYARQSAEQQAAEQ